MHEVLNDVRIEFMDKLSLPYVMMTINSELFGLLTRSDATAQIKLLVEQEELSPEEAQEIEDELKPLPMLDDWKQFREKVLALPLETAEFPLRFELCDCGAGLHGYIQTNDDVLLMDESVESLYDGCAQVDAGVQSGHVDLNNAVALLKCMVECKLPGSAFEESSEE